MVLTALQTVITIFVMISAGMFISWRKWVTSDSARLFPKIIINIALPAMIIYFFSEHLERRQLFESWLPLVIVFAIAPVSFILGKLVASIFRVPKERRGVFAVMFPFSNSMFIGLPVAYALFAEPGIPFAMFYYLSNTAFFWTLGYYSIRRDADILSGQQSSISFIEILKKVANPPTITLLAMFAVVLSDIELPSIIVDTARYLNGLTTPLSLLFMGCLIYGMGKTCVKFEKGLIPVMLGRFLLAPGLMFAACTAVIILFADNFPALDLTLMRSVFTVQAGLPVMTQTSIIASHCGADAEYATKSFFWTTLVSLATIPLYMLLFESIA